MSESSVVGIARHSAAGLGEGFGPYEGIESLRGSIREACRQILGDCGADESSLARHVRPGSTVLIKPNWVVHENRGDGGLDCLVTHPAFLVALCSELRLARPSKVIVGDAPIQGCDWSRLVVPELIAAVRAALAPIPVEFVDFRRTILSGADLARGVATDMRDLSRFTEVDLGRESLLEPVSRPAGRFRVTMYDPDALSRTHAPGKHRYLICREAFEADCVINAPKLKTHKKAGLTCALKNLVGINGNKEYLPHHRIGGSGWGGDCYEGWKPFKGLAELILDAANRRIGTSQRRRFARLSDRSLDAHALTRALGAYLSGRGEGASLRSLLRKMNDDRDLEGSWYGNDTVWRTALDLNRILLYGGADGRMSDVPQRSVLHLTDAIVCGQAEGPLSPQPLSLGVVTCATNAVAADAVHAALLGFDWRKLPIVREAFGDFRWPLRPVEGPVRGRAEGRELDVDEVFERFGRRATPPRGWAGHCERP